jgi:hypothetical protein
MQRGSNLGPFYAGLSFPDQYERRDLLFASRFIPITAAMRNVTSTVRQLRIQ